MPKNVVSPQKHPPNNVEARKFPSNNVQSKKTSPAGVSPGGKQESRSSGVNRRRQTVERSAKKGGSSKGF